MVRDGIVLGQKISEKGIDLDDFKITTTKGLLHSQDVKGARNFSGHASFYRLFVENFDKVSALLVAADASTRLRLP
jgi:hypothetical protein